MYLLSDGHQYELELLLGSDSARALVADVFQGGRDVDLLGAFSHTVQYHVDEAVRAWTTRAVTVIVHLSIIYFMWRPNSKG